MLNNKNKKARRAGFFVTKWLGCRDSNPGMLVSETRALPLGDTPIALNKLLNDFFKLAGVRGFEPRNAGIRNQSLTAWRYPNNFFQFTQKNGKRLTRCLRRDSNL